MAASVETRVPYNTQTQGHNTPTERHGSVKLQASWTTPGATGTKLVGGAVVRQGNYQVDNFLNKPESRLEVGTSTQIQRTRSKFFMGSRKSRAWTILLESPTLPTFPCEEEDIDSSGRGWGWVGMPGDTPGSQQERNSWVLNWKSCFY